MKIDNSHRQFIYQHWKHAHEQDQGHHLVFRTAKNEFPPSRGRVEFILKENDACSFLDIASSDGHVKNNCKLIWKADSASISVSYPNGRHRVFEIISVQADKLVLSEIY